MVFLSSIIIYMYKILLAAVASGMHLIYDPSIRVMTATKVGEYACTYVEGNPTVLNIGDNKCYHLMDAAMSSQSIVIDPDNDGVPDAVYSYVKGKGWVRYR